MSDMIKLTEELRQGLTRFKVRMKQTATMAENSIIAAVCVASRLPPREAAPFKVAVSLYPKIAAENRALAKKAEQELMEGAINEADLRDIIARPQINGERLAELTTAMEAVVRAR
jgi:hypothetical protein